MARLIASGATNREIAAALGVTPKTVGTHVARLYAKLDVRSRSQLAAMISGPSPAAPQLSAPERRLADLVAAGATNREIARVLFVSPRTVESRLRRLYQRHGFRSRADLAARSQTSITARPAEPDVSGRSASCQR